MGFELLAEEFEAGLGIGLESSFGQLANPTVWVSGKCGLKYEEGLRVPKMAINELDETHVSQGRVKADGTLNLQLCPGQEALFFHPTSGILQMRDRRHVNSFSVTQIIGDIEARYYNGVCVDKWTLKGKGGEDMALDLDCKAVNETVGAPMVPDYYNLPSPYILEELELAIGGKQRIEFGDIEISTEYGLRDEIYGNQLTRQDMTATKRVCSVKLTGWRSAGTDDLYAAYKSRTPVTGVATWRRGTSYVTATIPQAMVWSCAPDQQDFPCELKPLRPLVAGGLSVAWTYG